MSCHRAKTRVFAGAGVIRRERAKKLSRISSRQPKGNCNPQITRADNGATSNRGRPRKRLRMRTWTKLSASEGAGREIPESSVVPGYHRARLSSVAQSRFRLSAVQRPLNRSIGKRRCRLGAQFMRRRSWPAIGTRKRTKCWLQFRVTSWASRNAN